MELVQQEELIERRARGESIRKIAGEMKLSTATVFKWVRKLKRDVASASAIERDALFETFKGSVLARLEMRLQILGKIKAEAESRSFNDVPTDKLLALWCKIEQGLKEELKSFEDESGLDLLF